MKQTKEEKLIEDLTLLLSFLTAWEEDSTKNNGEMIKRSWKGYLFDILNSLEQKNFIYQLPKSTMFTNAGIVQAEKLLKKYIKN